MSDREDNRQKSKALEQQQERLEESKTLAMLNSTGREYTEVELSQLENGVSATARSILQIVQLENEVILSEMNDLDLLVVELNQAIKNVEQTQVSTVLFSIIQLVSKAYLGQSERIKSVINSSENLPWLLSCSAALNQAIQATQPKKT